MHKSQARARPKTAGAHPKNCGNGSGGRFRFCEVEPRRSDAFDSALTTPTPVPAASTNRRRVLRRKPRVRTQKTVEMAAVSVKVGAFDFAKCDKPASSDFSKVGVCTAPQSASQPPNFPAPPVRGRRSADATGGRNQLEPPRRPPVGGAGGRQPLRLGCGRAAQLGHHFCSPLRATCLRGRLSCRLRRSGRHQPLPACSRAPYRAYLGEHQPPPPAGAHLTPRPPTL
jgi:hypothetical protein